MKSTSLSKFPQNIELISGGAGHKLLEKSAVVIGFNTTAVLEAITVGIPAIVPNIFSDREKSIANHAQNVNDGVLVPTTTNELKTMILETVESKIKHFELTEGQKITLDKLLGNSDGNAGKRVRSFLDKCVEGSFLE